jgi:endonuclease/exonuclease/phosphatase family metal-dependent hydrolase
LQPASIKIISLNIEQDRHLDRVIPFILQQQAEIVLLQEVFEANIAELETSLKMKSIFLPLTYLKTDSGYRKLGVAIYSRLPFLQSDSYFYRGDINKLPYITSKEPDKMARALLTAEIAKGSAKFTCVNTHFTWSPNGTPNEDQKRDLDLMLKKLNDYPEFILAGDFNTPRGKIIYDTMSAKYQDNIPPDVVSTLDRDLHIAGHLDLVVDGLFTTPGYFVNHIEVIGGVSDHCAIVVSVSK